jgi:hypothetical protein
MVCRAHGADCSGNGGEGLGVAVLPGGQHGCPEEAEAPHEYGPGVEGGEGLCSVGWCIGKDWC